MSTVEKLPKIVQFLYTHDGGPCDDGPTAVCPHCGSDGRYVHCFKLEDGTTAGAMSGCIKLFPTSPVVTADIALTAKEKELAEKGWNLNSWQKKIRAAISAFYAEELSERDAMRTIELQKSQMASYRAAKRGGRRF